MEKHIHGVSNIDINFKFVDKLKIIRFITFFIHFIKWESPLKGFMEVWGLFILGHHLECLETFLMRVD